MSLKLTDLFESRDGFEDIANYQIPVIDMHLIKKALADDINGFVTNGLISLSASINSLNKRNYSWSFIQSYYTLFYFARAFNGINNYAIVYRKTKPYGIKVEEFGRFQKLKGNSHDVVLDQFKSHFGADTLVATLIEECSPVVWFNKSRNKINYSLNPQTDPIPPFGLFQHTSNLRKWMAIYINDINYAFDPAHCYLAYPIQLFLRIYSHYTENGITNNYLDDDRIEYFTKNICDEMGSISTIISRIKELTEPS